RDGAQALVPPSAHGDGDLHRELFGLLPFADQRLRSDAEFVAVHKRRVAPVRPRPHAVPELPRSVRLLPLAAPLSGVVGATLVVAFGLWVSATASKGRPRGSPLQERPEMYALPTPRAAPAPAGPRRPSRPYRLPSCPPT